jgi:hypothetical protein
MSETFGQNNMENRPQYSHAQAWRLLAASLSLAVKAVKAEAARTA